MALLQQLKKKQLNIEVLPHPLSYCILSMALWLYRISGMFVSDFNLAVWRIFFNRQTKVTANINFKRTL